MTRPDPDEYSLIAWLESQALKAHNLANIPPKTKGSTEGERHGYYMQEKAYNTVITHIHNSHTTELHRKLMEK